MNLSGTPFGVLSSHLLDEFNGLTRNAGFPTLGDGLPFPVAAKHIPLPAQDNIRLEDVQSRLPAVGQYHSSAVTKCEFWPFNRAFEDNELLTRG